MVPAEFLALVVLPSLEEMLAEPASQRRAYVACIVAAHLVDHVDVANGSPEFGKRDVRRAVGNVDPLVAGGLEIVEAVATGAKHAKPDARPSRPVKYAPGDERVVPAFAWDTWRPWWSTTSATTWPRRWPRSRATRRPIGASSARKPSGSMRPCARPCRRPNP